MSLLQTKVKRFVIDNIFMKQKDNERYCIEIDMIAYRQYNDKTNSFDVIVPEKYKKRIYEPAVYDYRLQIFSPYKKAMVPFDNEIGSHYGIKTDLDVLSLTQDERAHAVLKLASLNFGWIDYTKDVDRYHKTLPFIAGQRFTAFTFQVRRLETVSRNFYDKYKKIDYFVEPFGVDEPDHDFHFKLMKDIKDVSKQEYRSRRFNALSSRSSIS